MKRIWTAVFLAGFVVGVVGCSDKKGGTPEPGKNNLDLKPLPRPGSPGGGGDKQPQPGGGPGAQ